MTLEFKHPLTPMPTAGIQNGSVLRAMTRGFFRQCPRCNGASIFSGYLKIRHHCPACGLELHHHRADDLPPYLTITIVGHLVVGLMLAGWNVWHLSDNVQYALWPAMALVLSLALLPLIKGAVVGLQWALRMHGFGQLTD